MTVTGYLSSFISCVFPPQGPCHYFDFSSWTILWTLLTLWVFKSFVRGGCVCVWLFWIHICLCTIYMPGDCRGQRRASDSLQLELHCGAGAQEQPVLLTTELFLPALVCLFWVPGIEPMALCTHRWDLMLRSVPWPNYFFFPFSSYFSPSVPRLRLIHQLSASSLVLLQYIQYFLSELLF